MVHILNKIVYLSLENHGKLDRLNFPQQNYAS